MAGITSPAQLAGMFPVSSVVVLVVDVVACAAGRRAQCEQDHDGKRRHAPYPHSCIHAFSPACSVEILATETAAAFIQGACQTGDAIYGSLTGAGGVRRRALCVSMQIFGTLMRHRGAPALATAPERPTH